jgi:hypothetical protein
VDGRTDRRTNGRMRGCVVNLALKDYYNKLSLYHSNHCLFRLTFQETLSDDKGHLINSLCLR